MATGPTASLAADDSTGYEVTVTWGSQDGHLKARTLQSALECADRLAYVFCEMRDAKMIRD